MVEPEDITAHSKLINAVMNESSIKAIGGSGSRDILITEPESGRKLTRLEWYSVHQNDGLALWAVRNKRTKIAMQMRKRS